MIRERIFDNFSGSLRCAAAYARMYIINISLNNWDISLKLFEFVWK